MNHSPRCNLLVIRSPDIEATATFYGAMGLKMHRHAHGTGPDHYCWETDGFVFEIYPLSKRAASTAGLRLGFVVDDVEQTVTDLAAIGAIVLTDPSDSEWGRRAVVKDLDGHTLELLEREIRPDPH